MTLDVDGRLLALVDSVVAEGKYASREDVIADALQHWSGVREQHSIETVRRLYDEGIASGFEDHDGMDGIKAEGLRRLDAQRAAE